MSLRIQNIEAAIVEAVGERCPDVMQGCAACDTGAELDALVDTIARQQEMLDRALEASFADKARADRAEEDDKRGDAHGDEDARHTSPQKCAAKAIPRITGSPAG